MLGVGEALLEAQDSKAVRVRLLLRLLLSGCSIFLFVCPAILSLGRWASLGMAVGGQALLLCGHLAITYISSPSAALEHWKWTSPRPLVVQQERAETADF